ncbi:MAG: hypothetical protein ACK5X3_20375 [Pseudomonadota bacterium]|jgi:hypothetical protein
MPEVITDRLLRSRLHKKGREMYVNGSVEPYPDAEYQTENYYINAGWKSVVRDREEAFLARNLEMKQRLGIDDESLDKLRNGLRELGFKIPNEEN